MAEVLVPGDRAPGDSALAELVPEDGATGNANLQAVDGPAKAITPNPDDTESEFVDSTIPVSTAPEIPATTSNNSPPGCPADIAEMQEMQAPIDRETTLQSVSVAPEERHDSVTNGGELAAVAEDVATPEVPSQTSAEHAKQMPEVEIPQGEAYQDIERHSQASDTAMHTSSEQGQVPASMIDIDATQEAHAAFDTALFAGDADVGGAYEAMDSAKQTVTQSCEDRHSTVAGQTAAGSAMASPSADLSQYLDLGNMTSAEIDELLANPPPIDNIPDVTAADENLASAEPHVNRSSPNASTRSALNLGNSMLKSPAALSPSPAPSHKSIPGLGTSMLRTPSAAALSAASRSPNLNANPRVPIATPAAAPTPKTAGTIWIASYNKKRWPVVLCDGDTAPPKFMATKSGNASPAILLGRRI